ncbi:hypothetical protein NYE69_28130 [Paenibacillus sp. FSL R5-0527]|uniref:hypothetical protein n=1 Tax=Paenibacillus sp. FSL R5-0527 TaxID=2975321 RepID=UPI000979FCC8|nr:hypothetical protein BK140_11260 [Paenibacillus macerans]
MNIQRAKKRELLQVALHEECDLAMKYAAARELQRRGKSRFPETVQRYDDREKRIIADLYMKGYRLRDIARRFGRSKQAIKDKLQEMHREGLPFRTIAMWTRSGYEPRQRAAVK